MHVLVIITTFVDSNISLFTSSMKYNEIETVNVRIDNCKVILQKFIY